MNRDAKEAFIVGLVETVRKDVLANLDRVPETWTGAEIRQYLADKFGEAAKVLPMGQKRFREYANDVVVRNL